MNHYKFIFGRDNESAIFIIIWCRNVYFFRSTRKKGAGINAANIYFRWLIWLLAFGLIHGYLLLWTGEILYDYALMGFIVYSFRNMAPLKLTIVALILFSVGSLWSYVDYKKDVKFMEDVALIKTYKSENKNLN
ncbi:MAG: hypothetical protein ABF260_06435 [Flavobacteriaceae bacterium]